ncbi:hypothetical protein HDA32_002039 [Spinactinospora alkalitolerans]|uniref:Uncharacterized protein n=1 Tax=Spinactinospora alkalitolerans TaxID=687207 RepID=A0A852TSC5_9ACTN|nr:hypothetical protein [Spinactinospora alkalitolerans]NYE46919.1 hypothetical protein [Spinactinospora alkalitolerans]
MTLETPPAGTPGLAGVGHDLDFGGSDAPWARALRVLTAELQARGVDALADDTIGAVDAALRGPLRPGGRRGTQRAVLRPHRGRLWWWLHAFPEHGAAAPLPTPLVPAADSAAAARRIARMLRRAGTGPPGGRPG